jgi:hypothetical protein
MMASEYQPISESEMMEFLGEQGFTKIECPGSQEIVMSKLLRKEGGWPICMRIYTSIAFGAGRECGEDAIRSVLVTKVKEGVRPFGKARRVYRVKGWKANLQSRIDNWEENLSPPCPKCGAPMTLRKGRNGEFWGCITWAQTKCNGSHNVEESK